MEKRSIKIASKVDSKITIQVVPGHFATNHSHINYYVDLTNIKVQHKMAQRAAAELARKYRITTVDTIICMEGTEMVGAFMAADLAQPGHMDMNSGNDIAVVTPELNINNQLIFRDNVQKMVWEKNVLLLISTASTGKTINRALECLDYYKGNLVGICALFSAAEMIRDMPVNAVFTAVDLPHYHTYLPAECDMCAKKEKIDAIANSFGYSKL